MARNGSGVYSPPAASYPAVSGTLIESVKFNAVIDDMSTAISESVPIDGQRAMTGDLPMGAHKITGLADGTNASDVCALGQAQSLADVATNTVAAAAVTPADADVIPAAVGGVLKKVTWANLKATLKAYFDPIYASIAGSASQAFSMATAAAGTNTTQGATTAFANAINLPAFRAYAGAATSITAALVKVGFNSESFDSSSAFDSTTNSRFQPSVAGWYQCHAHVQFSSSSYVAYIALYKNGAAEAYSQRTQGASLSAGASTLIYLNGSTDYVEVFASSATTQDTAIGGSSITFFEAFRIFGA